MSDRLTERDIRQASAGRDYAHMRRVFEQAKAEGWSRDQVGALLDSEIRREGFYLAGGMMVGIAIILGLAVVLS